MTFTQSSSQEFNVLESIKAHISQLKPFIPKQAVICLGEYPTKILAKWSLLNETNSVLPVFIGKSSSEIAKWTENRLDNYNIIGLNKKVTTDFWFDTFSTVTKDSTILNQLKDKTLERLQNMILVFSTWEGTSSGLTPALISQLKDWNINNLAIAILPSRSQPADAQFNALSSLGKSLSHNTPLLLIERDRLEKCVGVNRSGNIIKGKIIINNILNVMLNREDIINEIVQLSKSHKVKKFTILPIMGASLEIYGSLKNILDSALLRQLLSFDLSTATVAYIILKAPLHLKEIIRKEDFELTVSKWLKKMGKFRSIHVTEPLYIKDPSDRVDIIMLIGGFDTGKLFSSLINEVNEIKKYSIEQKYMKKEEWNEIVKNLF